MSGIGAGLSAVMNNVAALALLMPVDIQTARKAGRGPALSLMPLSFATILGGMATLIGTPPNIIIASYRGEALREPFLMFDFAPVGLICALAGLAFVADAADTVLDLHGMEGGQCIFLCSGSEAVEYGVRVAQAISDRPLLMTMHDSYFGAYGSAHRREASVWFSFDWRACAHCDRYIDDCDEQHGEDGQARAGNEG